jgi:hypothetical protein
MHGGDRIKPNNKKFRYLQIFQKNQLLKIINKKVDCLRYWQDT